MADRHAPLRAAARRPRPQSPHPAIAAVASRFIPAPPRLGPRRTGAGPPARALPGVSARGAPQRGRSRTRAAAATALFAPLLARTASSAVAQRGGGDRVERRLGLGNLRYRQSPAAGASRLSAGLEALPSRRFPPSLGTVRRS